MTQQHNPPFKHELGEGDGQSSSISTLTRVSRTQAAAARDGRSGQPTDAGESAELVLLVQDLHDGQLQSFHECIGAIELVQNSSAALVVVNVIAAAAVLAAAAADLVTCVLESEHGHARRRSSCVNRRKAPI